MIQQYLEAGTIVNVHGIRGEVKVKPWADGPEFLTLFDRVYIQGKEYAVERARVQKTCTLMKLQGVDSVEAAQLLRGQTVKVDRDDVELDEGVYFIADLVGLTVLDGDRVLGKVVEVLTLPANDVYVVREGRNEYLIPGVPEFIEEISLEEGIIRVNLIPGMADDEEDEILEDDSHED